MKTDIRTLMGETRNNRQSCAVVLCALLHSKATHHIPFYNGWYVRVNWVFLRVLSLQNAFSFTLIFWRTNTTFHIHSSSTSFAFRLSVSNSHDYILIDIRNYVETPSTKDFRGIQPDYRLNFIHYYQVMLLIWNYF